MKIVSNYYCITALFVAILFLPRLSMAHCQIPCGIYDDHARVMSMLEDVQTIAKSIHLINELAAKTDAQSKQQFVRWVMNKEEHSQKIISTIADYFLTQRIKANQADYVERLKKHHAVIVAAMKAKQSADPQASVELEDCVKSLLVFYPEHKD